jgi:hypothetical protein
VWGFELWALCLLSRHSTNSATLPATPPHFFSFFGGTGIWIQGFTLANYHLSHTSSPFSSGYFEMEWSHKLCAEPMCLNLSPPDLSLPTG